MVLSPFVTMKAFFGPASTASLILKFCSKRCCGVVSCPLELRRKQAKTKS